MCWVVVAWGKMGLILVAHPSFYPDFSLIRGAPLTPQCGITFFLRVPVVQAASSNKNIPIMQCHGERDFMIPLEFGVMTHGKLKSIVNPDLVDFKAWPGLAHCSSPEVLYSTRSSCLNSTFTWHLKTNYSLNPTTTGQLTTLKCRIEHKVCCLVCLLKSLSTTRDSVHLICTISNAYIVYEMNKAVWLSLLLLFINASVKSLLVSNWTGAASVSRLSQVHKHTQF